MPPLSFKSNLRLQLLSLLLLVPVVVAVFAAREATERREEAARQVLARVEDLAALVSRQQNALIESSRQMLTLIALLPEVRSSDAATCNAFLATALPNFPQWANLGVIEPTGKLRCSALPADPNLDLSDRPYFRRAMSHRAFAIGDYQVGRITGRPGLNFGLPVLDVDGIPIAVVFGAMDLAWLAETMAGARFHDEALLLVTDMGGRVLVAWPPGSALLGEPATASSVFSVAWTSDEVVRRVKAPDGQDLVLARVTVQPAGDDAAIQVAVAVPSESAYAATRDAFTRELGLVAGMLLLATLTVSAADFWLLRRLQAIVVAAGRLARGDLGARTGLRRIGDPIGALALAFDVMAENVQAQTQQLAHEATHDPLTGLPNRAGVHRALDEVMAQGAAAVLLVIIDRLHEVVNTLGHPTGDTLLREIGPRLRRVLGPDTRIGRVGGGEFAVVLPREPADTEGPLRAARAVSTALSEPFLLDGITIEPGGAVGVALAPEHGTDPDRLLQRAGVAAVIARRGGLEPAVYQPELDPFSARRLRLIGALRKGVERGEMSLMFQPKVDLATGRATGCEALVRWHHPELGDISPVEFVGLAEQTGVIRPLTTWVIGEAMACARLLRDRGLSVRVSANISARDLVDPHFDRSVEARLVASGASPTDVELEVTESALMIDPILARRTLTRLRDRGFHLSVDDFGTGYSSLAYLRDLPVHAIKIDKSFVRGEGPDLHDPAITRSIVELGHNLGMTVVAEGVHTAQAANELHAFGCDLGQGEWFGAPMALPVFDRWLRDSRWAVMA